MRRDSRRLLPFHMLDLFPVMAHFMAEEDKSGGGTDKEKDADKSKDKEEKKDEPTEEDRIQQRVEAALAAEREKARKQAEKDKADADAKAAKEKGEFETLYQSESAKTTKLEGDLLQTKLDLRRERITNRLRKAVASDHPAYVGVVDDYMAPLLKIDSPDYSDDDADKQIKDVVAKYVKDNPRGDAKSFTTTTHPVRGKSAGEGGDGGDANRRPAVARNPRLTIPAASSF